MPQSDNIFDPAKIKAIQTEERAVIKGMSINELADHIESIRLATRELALRMVAANEELHTRLSTKDSTELEHLIERVPAASATLANRGHNHKPKKETFEQKVTRRMENESRKNPLMAKFLEELKASGK